MKSSWREEFNLDEVHMPSYTSKKDYELLQDKELLDLFRLKIIEGIIDNYSSDDKVSLAFIEDEISRVTEGYDITGLEREYLLNLINDEINWFGPITDALCDKNISEIMVNAPNEVYIEVDGQLIKDDNIKFINDEHIVRCIQRMIQPLGRTIDSSNPMVDSRLEDGSRINAIIPPLAVNGPVITIRKFKKTLNNIDAFIGNGTMTPYMARFLATAVKARCSILISGGTGSGKTTLLNVLSNFIPNYERVITIEDAVELELLQEHVISLEARKVNYENKGEVTIRDLVRNSLRMRPDRIIVGEVRGKEAFDMLQAMNTGHEGSLTTIHANGCKDAINRLETLVMMDEMEIPLNAVRNYIANAIELVVNIERLPDGKRKITSISEVVGYENGEIILNNIFEFRKKAILDNLEVDGEFVLYKGIPTIMNKIEKVDSKTLEGMFVSE